MALLDLILHSGTLITHKLAGYIYDWMVQVSGTLDASAQPAQTRQASALIDPQSGVNSIANSLVCPYLGVPEWLSVGLALRPLPAQGTIDSPNDAAWVNPFGNVGGTGQMSHLFKPPPGTTTATVFTFSVRAKMPASVANNTISVIIYNFDLATPLVSQVFTLTQAAQTCSVSVSNLDPTKFYQVAFQVNGTAQQCNPLIGKLTLTFSGGGTGTFSGAFVRHRLTAPMALHNHLTGFNGQLFPWINPLSDFVMSLNADTFAYEAYNSGNNGAGGTVTNLWILAGGSNVQDGKAIALSTLDMEDVTINASTRDNQTVTLRTGQGISTATSPATIAGWPNFGGTIPRAIYVPLGAKLAFRANQSQSEKTMIIFTDSIGIGVLSTDPGQQCWIQGLRQQFPGNVIVEGYGAQTLFAWIGNANAAMSLAVARYLCRDNPDIIVIDVMYNDYAVATQTAAQYQTNLQSLCSNIQTISPATDIWLLATGVTTNEGVGINNLPAFRTSMGTVATNLGGGVAGPKIFFVDKFANAKGVGGTQLFHSAAELADPAHPTSKGQGMDAVGMLQYMQGQGAF